MKPKIRRSSLGLLLATLCVGVFVLAVVKSGNYNVPVGARITQQSVRAKLDKSHSGKPTSDQAATVKANQQSKNGPALANTGPGFALLLFLPITIASYVVACCYLSYRTPAATVDAKDFFN